MLSLNCLMDAQTWQVKQLEQLMATRQLAHLKEADYNCSQGVKARYGAQWPQCAQGSQGLHTLGVIACETSLPAKYYNAELSTCSHYPRLNMHLAHKWSSETRKQNFQA